MKARNTGKVLNPSTGKYESAGTPVQTSLDSQKQDINSSKFDRKSEDTKDTKKDSNFKSRKRLDLKDNYESILKDEKVMEGYIKSDFPMNLQSVVKYDLTNVTKNSFMYLVSNAPFVYRWLFVSIFKQGLKIPELYDRYYNIPMTLGITVL